MNFGEHFKINSELEDKFKTEQQYCDEKSSVEFKPDQITDKVITLLKGIWEQIRDEKNKKNEEDEKLKSTYITSCMLESCRMSIPTDNKKLQAFCFIEKISLFFKIYLRIISNNPMYSQELINTLKTELEAQFTNVLEHLNPNPHVKLMD
jgi:hypothetical protein